jgi:LysM repeat protein
MFGRILMVSLVAAVAWAVLTRPSSGAGRPQVYVVKPGDTLWSIASERYGGDPRPSIYRLERRNHLHGTTLSVGERLVLP